MNENELPNLGKFKTVEALLDAYTALEAEFTKKCQQLGELTKERDNASEPVAPLPLYDREDWKEILGDFFSEYPESQRYAAEIGKILMTDNELATCPEGLTKAYLRTLVSRFRTPEQYMEDEDFIKNYVLVNDNVKEKIIADYVESLAGGTPPDLAAKGGQAVLTPARKPKNLKDAAKLALKMLG